MKPKTESPTQIDRFERIRTLAKRIEKGANPGAPVWGVTPTSRTLMRINITYCLPDGIDAQTSHERFVKKAYDPNEDLEEPLASQRDTDLLGESDIPECEVAADYRALGETRNHTKRVMNAHGYRLAGTFRVRNRSDLFGETYLRGLRE